MKDTFTTLCEVNIKSTLIVRQHASLICYFVQGTCQCNVWETSSITWIPPKDIKHSDNVRGKVELYCANNQLQLKIFWVFSRDKREN